MKESPSASEEGSVSVVMNEVVVIIDRDFSSSKSWRGLLDWVYLVASYFFEEEDGCG